VANQKIPVPAIRSELPDVPPRILLREADELLRSASTTGVAARWGSSTRGAVLRALAAIVVAKAKPAGRARSLPRPAIWELAKMVAPELTPAIGRLQDDALDLPNGDDLLREIRNLINEATRICAKTYV
jgi:hypothetical protein